MKLETTTNYNRFSKNPEQRTISELHANNIAKSMMTAGFLPSKPIQCYKKGDGLIIVDGHHRFEAAKSIGIPVYFFVEADEETRKRNAKQLRRAAK